MINLYSNAAKYNRPGGSVSLSSIWRPEQGEMVTIELCIKDTGVGLSEEQQKNIFLKQYYLLTTSGSRTESSSGLGLYITGKLIDKLGGKIRVKSELGVGLIFTVELMLQRGKMENLHSVSKPEGKKKCVNPRNILRKLPHQRLY